MTSEPCRCVDVIYSVIDFSQRYFNRVLISFFTVQLAAGLVGRDEFNFWYAGSLVSLNTAGYDLLGFVSLWALIVVSAPPPFQPEAPAPTEHDTGCEGERVLCDSSSRSGVAHHVLFTSFVYHLGVLLGSMASALLQCRHLMLWAVFAPKVFILLLYNLYL
jgi:hypothetical protein